MHAEGQVTRNYEFIRNWVTKRNGCPGLRRLITFLKWRSHLPNVFISGNLRVGFQVYSNREKKS